MYWYAIVSIKNYHRLDASNNKNVLVAINSRLWLLRVNVWAGLSSCSSSYFLTTFPLRIFILLSPIRQYSLFLGERQSHQAKSHCHYVILIYSHLENIFTQLFWSTEYWALTQHIEKDTGQFIAGLLFFLFFFLLAWWCFWSTLLSIVECLPYAISSVNTNHFFNVT